MKDPIRTLSRYPEWKDQAARWFHQKWGIPLAAYLESMNRCLEGTTLVPPMVLCYPEGNHHRRPGGHRKRLPPPEGPGP